MDKMGGHRAKTFRREVTNHPHTLSFAYGTKYYKQIKGGAMGSPFTMVLANIYMLEWEQPLIEHQQHHNELYGR